MTEAELKAMLKAPEVLWSMVQAEEETEWRMSLKVESTQIVDWLDAEAAELWDSLPRH